MKNLRAYREPRGWSQSELARRAGLHSTTVSLIETGRLSPYPGQLTKLAKALRLSGRERDIFLRERNRDAEDR
jgi:transcriptional regulator with XRE-family HTH domain